MDTKDKDGTRIDFTVRGNVVIITESTFDEEWCGRKVTTSIVKKRNLTYFSHVHVPGRRDLGGDREHDQFMLEGTGDFSLSFHLSDNKLEVAVLTLNGTEVKPEEFVAAVLEWLSEPEPRGRATSRRNQPTD